MEHQKAESAGTGKKTLIIYKSQHRGNTERIARIMAQAMNADLATIKDVRLKELDKYDLIGFGSGIYVSNFHNKIYKLIRKMPSGNKKTFIFCTAGSGEFKKKGMLLEKLSEKGCNVIGEFICPGEFSPLGFNLDKKGHPDPKDLEDARIFAEGLLKL